MLAKPLRILAIRLLAKEKGPISSARKQRRHSDQAVVPAKKMSACAAPRVVFSAGREAGPNRIELDISSGRERVRVVHHVGSEASLPEVTTPTLASVDLGRIAPVRFADGLAQTIWRSGNRYEMDVVRHEAVGPDLDPMPVAPFAHEGEVQEVVVSAEERLLPAVTPLRDVVRQERDDRAGHAGHGDRVPTIARMWLGQMTDAAESPLTKVGTELRMVSPGFPNPKGTSSVETDLSTMCSGN